MPDQREPTHLIRQARPEDAQQAAQVLQRSIREVCGPDYAQDPETLTQWCANKTELNLSQWITNPSNYLIVVQQCRSEQLVGVGLLDRVTAKIKLCYLSPEALHQGLGQRLLQRLEQEAQRLGMSQIQLESSLTAHAFYLRNGYQSDGEPDRQCQVRCLPLVKFLVPAA